MAGSDLIFQLRAQTKKINFRDRRSQYFVIPGGHNIVKTIETLYTVKECTIHCGQRPQWISGQSGHYSD